MKKIISLFTFVLVYNYSFCQSRYVFIDFKDGQKPAIQNEFSFADKTVEGAIDARLAKMGYKGKESKGYTVYRGVKLSELGNQPYDLYFKVERKSRKDKDVAVVNMLISNGNEVFVSDQADSITIRRGKTFLDNFRPDIEAFDLQQQVNDQQEAVTKAEKKYKSLQDDADDLQKKKSKLEQQIDDNLKAQKDQKAEIEKQKQLFELIKGKQKN
jgi:hypothetical protein